MTAQQLGEALLAKAKPDSPVMFYGTVTGAMLVVFGKDGEKLEAPMVLSNPMKQPEPLL